MKNEFTLAFNEVLQDKQLPREVVMEALEAAMVSAYRRAVNASNAQQVEAKIDSETGKVRIFAEKEVVDSVQDPRTEVTLEEALQFDSNAELGEMVLVDSTPQDFGRVAAQTARQVIQQRIREAEREAQLEYFAKQEGEIVSGIVQAVTPQAVTLGLDMKAEGVMPRNQQIGGERFRLHDRVRALLLEAKSSPRGPQLILSRAHRNFLRRLLENEVPEIYHGLVEIRSIAREPGQRSKVAVAALQAGVDPVGACVGIRGVRIQAIVRELNDEKIDVIEWNPDPEAYIAKALSPARVNGVYLNEHARGTKTATVVVPEDQLSLAIGRDGQNARLAAKLTSWRIDIKSLPEAAADALHRIQTREEFAYLLERESEAIVQIENILAKKSEGRPVTPEEYNLLTQFVDRVERTILQKRAEKRSAEIERRERAQAEIPQAAFDVPLEALGFSEYIQNLLNEENYKSVGDLMLQMKLDPDEILEINGIGPKTMEEIVSALELVTLPEPEAEVEEAAEAAVEEDHIETAAEVEAEPEVIVAEEATVEAAEPVEAGELEEAEPVEAAASEIAPEVEPVAAAQEVEAVEAEPSLIEKTEEKPEAEEEKAFEELFQLQPEVITELVSTDEEELEDEDEEDYEDKGKKKKKKKKYIQMEYDPDKDVVIVKRKRKRSGGEWKEDWEI